MPDALRVPCPVEGCGHTVTLRSTEDDAELDGQIAARTDALRAEHPNHPPVFPHVAYQSPAFRRMIRDAAAHAQLAANLADQVRPLLSRYAEITEAARQAMVPLPTALYPSLFEQMRATVAQQDVWRAASRSLTDSMHRVMSDLPRIDFAAITRALRLHQADNWAELDLVDFLGNDALVALADQGIAVAWVPRAIVLRTLLDAGDAEARKQVLLEHEQDVLDDCLAAIDCVRDEPLTGPAQLLRQAIAAARDKHHGPAQALAANVLDTVLRLAFPFGPWQGYRTVREAVADLRDRGEVRQLRPMLAFAPVIVATTTFRAAKDSVPEVFNRHASAHAAGSVQYTRVNALIALLAAASVLRETFESSPTDDVAA